MKKYFTALTIIIAFLLTACNHAENMASEATENENVAEESTQIEQNLTTNTTTAQQKVIAKVQIIRNEKDFYEKVCEIDPNKGVRFKGELPAIVDFYADWCGPCQQISPYLAEFAEKYAGQIVIYKVNVDKCPDLAQVFKVQSIPNLIFFKANQQPQQIVGALPKAELEKTIQDILLK